MDNTKQHVRDVLDRLADDCSIEDVQYHIYVAETVAHRRDLASREATIPHREAEASLKKWLIQ